MNDFAWMNSYLNRLMERGLPFQDAREIYDAGIPHDVNYDPIQAADDELSYYVSDG